MEARAWQERLYRHSLMKKEKVRLLAKRIDFNDKKIFDLGCSAGAVSYQLKKRGGHWLHADLDLEILRAAKELLGNDLVQVSPDSLPCKNGAFDLILALDFLEHVENDSLTTAEAARLLKSGGRIALSTPIHNGFFLLNRLKKFLGLKPELYGHRRQGYSLQDLNDLLHRHGFTVEYAGTYAKFFVELCETLLNWLYVKKEHPANRQRSGHISPSSRADMDRSRTWFNIYSVFVYPFVYLLTRFDRLLWFKTGYATLVIGRKT